jgi:hypothetical protein
MLQRSFLFLMMVISFTGCTTIHKAQTLPVTPKSATAQEEQSTNEKDKVWVEAETKKIWVNNHVDESGDMVEGHYKHIIVTPGHWAVKDGGKK